jgi:hypothetical protein
MLVSLADMKTYLGETTTDYDVFLTEQLSVVSEAVENYCGRKFAQANYTQTFYYKDFKGENVDKLPLYHYPVSTITSVEKDGEVVDPADYRVSPKTWFLQYENSQWFTDQYNIVVEYTAGYATIPMTIQACVKSIVEEKYNKKKSGVAINFGQDVQQISIPGSINIAFDYTLQANERKSKFGMILGNWANVLDSFRSERPIVGTITGGEYVV